MVRYCSSDGQVTFDVQYIVKSKSQSNIFLTVLSMVTGQVEKSVLKQK